MSLLRKKDTWQGGLKVGEGVNLCKIGFKRGWGVGDVPAGQNGEVVRWESDASL